MFTGIINHTAIVETLSSLGEGIQVGFKGFPTDADIVIGDSISINGVCSTVVTYNKGIVSVDYLKETLTKSTFSDLKKGDVVNVEYSLRFQGKVSGHFVTGHVDTTGVIQKFEHRSPWSVITISFDPSFAPLIIEKGSISLDGISLTLVDITKDSFSCHLIPHTINETILKYKNVGDCVNLEFDLMGKYVLRQTECGIT